MSEARLLLDEAARFPTSVSSSSRAIYAMQRSLEDMRQGMPIPRGPPTPEEGPRRISWGSLNSRRPLSVHRRHNSKGEQRLPPVNGDLSDASDDVVGQLDDRQSVRSTRSMRSAMGIEQLTVRRETEARRKEEEANRREEDASKEEEARHLEETARQFLEEGRRFEAGVRLADASAKVREAATQTKEVEAKKREAEAQFEEEDARGRELEARRNEDDACKREDDARRTQSAFATLQLLPNVPRPPPIPIPESMSTGTKKKLSRWKLSFRKSGGEASTNTRSDSQRPHSISNQGDVQARRERIVAVMAMGGMHVGTMLPTKRSIAQVSTPPSPPISVRSKEEATLCSPWHDIVPQAPRQPVSYYYGPEQEYEQPSSSDDGVLVEAEESEFEEMGHGDLDDGCNNGGVEGDKDSEDRYDNGGIDGEIPVVPPSPPARSTRSLTPMTRPPTPTTHPPIPPSRPPGRGGSESSSTITSFPLPPIRQHASDFVSMAYAPSRLSKSSPLPPLTGGALQQPVGQWPCTSALVPSQMTSDDLRALWDRVGVYVGEAASRLLKRSKSTLVGNGSYESFVAEALAQVPNALPPQSPGEYGILIYAQVGVQVHTRVTDILPGDIVVLDAAKLTGHKYKGFNFYFDYVGEGTPRMGVVSEFDVKKLKLKVLQASQRVGLAVRICFVWLILQLYVECVLFSSQTVELVSYRLEDLKSGTIKVRERFSMPSNETPSHSLFAPRFIVYGKHKAATER